MKKIHSKNNFVVLTAMLVCVLLAAAVVGSTPEGANYLMIQTALLLTQLAAYFSLNLSRSWRRFVVLILVLMLISIGLHALTDWTMTPLLGQVASLIFFWGMVYAASRQVLLHGSIDHNTIVGTVAVYLLLGLAWAMMYLLSLEFWPEGINGIEYRDWHDNLGAAIYFSFITMTTAGYGDITPVLPVTRTLAYLQAITGTFYMAIVVANLVGAFSRASK